MTQKQLSWNTDCVDQVNQLPSNQAVQPANQEQQHKHTILAVVAIIFGAFFLILSLIFLILIIPQLTILYKNLNLKTNFLNVYGFTLALLFLGILNIFTGTKLLKSKSQKWFIIVIVLGIITLPLAGIISNFFITTTMTPLYSILNQNNISQSSISPTPTSFPIPTKDPTADWKTYINPENGYLIKYPPTWKLKENDGGAFFSPNEIIFIEGPAAPVEIEVKKNLFAEKEIADYKKSYKYTNFSDENIFIGNVLVRKTMGIVDSSMPYIGNYHHGLVFIPKGKDIILIQYFERPEVSIELFNQIVSTFKLTESVKDISNWKLYKNNKYGFSFKYPSNWIARSIEDEAIFYPEEQLSKKDLEIVNKKFPIFDQTHLSAKIISKPITFTPESLPAIKISYTIGPMLIYVNGKQGYYYQHVCAPKCPIQFDVSYDSSKTFELNLSSDGKENIDSVNKAFGMNLQDIDDDTFKTIISTLQFK